MERHILRRWVLATFGCLAFIGIAAVLSKNLHQVREVTFEGIPIPFAQDATNNLKGTITNVGTKNGIQVQRVTFPSGTVEENLNVDKIYLVSIPTDSSLTNLPLATAVSAVTDSTNHAINYYGYKYSTNTATQEIQNKNDTSFSVRFPGEFFASTSALADSQANLSGFAATRNITFINAETSDQPKIGGNLFILIVNESGGGKFSITPNAVCGDSVITGSEACDDGAAVSDDGCSSTCAIESGYTCTTTSPSVCSLLCGNGDIDSGEECDQGLNINGTPDAECSSTCTITTPLPF